MSLTDILISTLILSVWILMGLMVLTFIQLKKTLEAAERIIIQGEEMIARFKHAKANAGKEVIHWTRSLVSHFLRR